MTVVELPTPRILARSASLLVLGAFIGVVGTGVHRMARPWGLALALVLVVLGGVVARAWVGALGVLAVGLGVAMATAVLGAQGPGGDVLIVADAIGYVWYGGAVAAAVALILPRSWFRDSRPVRGEPT